MSLPASAKLIPTILLKAATAAAWTAANPVLAAGEPGLETDTGPRLKFGDGVTAWAGLGYAPAGPMGIVGATGATGPAGPAGVAGAAGVDGTEGADAVVAAEGPLTYDEATKTVGVEDDSITDDKLDPAGIRNDLEVHRRQYSILLGVLIAHGFQVPSSAGEPAE